MADSDTAPFAAVLIFHGDGGGPTSTALKLNNVTQQQSDRPPIDKSDPVEGSSPEQALADCLQVVVREGPLCLLLG